MLLVWLEPAQPDHACYQQKRVSPTNMSHTLPQTGDPEPAEDKLTDRPAAVLR